jgi:hypothetical protein
VTSWTEFHYSQSVEAGGDEYTLIKKRDAAGNPIEGERLNPADVTKVFTEDGELIAFEIRRHA